MGKSRPGTELGPATYKITLHTVDKWTRVSIAATRLAYHEVWPGKSITHFLALKNEICEGRGWGCPERVWFVNVNDQKRPKSL